MILPFTEIHSDNLFGLLESLQKHLEHEGLDQRAADVVIERGVAKLLRSLQRQRAVAKMLTL